MFCVGLLVFAVFLCYVMCTMHAICNDAVSCMLICAFCVVCCMLFDMCWLLPAGG